MQTRRHSLIEQLVNTAVGFVLSVLVWEWLIKPIWHIETHLVDNLAITSVFTVVSIFRGYAVRRFFNSLNKKNNKEGLHEDTDSRGDWPRP